MLPTLIQRHDKKSFYFLSISKIRDSLKFYRLSYATFYYRINTIYRLLYGNFQIIPHIIPRHPYQPEADMGVSGWYGVWYENCHIIIYLSYIFLSDKFAYIICGVKSKTAECSKCGDIINTIIKCTWPPVKFQLVWCSWNEMTFYCISVLMLPTLIQRQDKKSIYFLSISKIRLTEILQAVRCHILLSYQYYI